MTNRHKRMWWAALITGLGLSAPAHATVIDVLWYTYADPASEYRQQISLLSSVVQTLPQSSGLSWNLTYFSPASATPNFAAFDVLVIESGEAFRTGAPGGPLATPNYSGILNNKAAIEAARGDRTFISGADSDFHTVRGDTGNIPDVPDPPGGKCVPAITSADCWDGALGHSVNAVNWAASGNGLGIVSFLDGEFLPGAFWWTHPDSFLRSELDGYVSYAGSDNAPIIDLLAASYPLNFGLTSLGLSDWDNSFHAFFLDTIPNYTQIVDSSLHPAFAGAIATSRFASAPTTPDVTVDAPGTLFLFALGLTLGLVRLRSHPHRQSTSSHPNAADYVS